MTTDIEPTNQHRPFALVGLALTGVLTGAALGALTNCINGRVSPLYFRNILGWHDVDDVLFLRAMAAAKRHNPLKAKDLQSEEYRNRIPCYEATCQIGDGRLW